MLKLENISKSYVQRGLVLDNVCFEANQGDSISVTGPSGSGKTTLMNIIGALEKPDKGRVIFNGETLNDLLPDDLARHRNRNIGFVFQEHMLMKHLTLLENIMLPVFTEKMEASAYFEKENYALDLMKRIGIAEIRAKYPYQVSGGEAQRATLVRALIRKPALLLADEPTGSLDLKNADMLGNLLMEINRDLGVTIIVVTHSSSIASKMEKHLSLVDGKLQ
jgi:ABC-type lipoprotein export system ATPase subunit